MHGGMIDGDGTHRDVMYGAVMHGDAICGDATCEAVAPSRPTLEPWARKGLFSTYFPVGLYFSFHHLLTLDVEIRGWHPQS